VSIINRNAWLFAGAGVLLAGAVWFFGWRTKSSGKLAQAESGYVNPAACDGCHSEISKS
jgi:hypothetical protein